MSQATEDDLQKHLAQLRDELRETLHQARRQHDASMSMKGTLGSGGDLKGSVGAMETTLFDHLDAIAPLIDRWQGPNLSADRAREMIVAYFQSATDEFATAEATYKAGSRRTPESARKLLDGILAQSRARLFARLREFELGADRASDAGGANVNIVHANNIIGGVVQAGGNAAQANTVQVSAEAIGASLDHLLSHLADAPAELRERLEPEAVTIRAQLSKPEPNSTIVQEAGRTIRAVVEGAAGGAMGAVMTPGIVQAVAAFSAALGLA